jgi:hypothetical protein
MCGGPVSKTASWFRMRNVEVEIFPRVFTKDHLCPGQLGTAFHLNRELSLSCHNRRKNSSTQTISAAHTATPPQHNQYLLCVRANTPGLLSQRKQHGLVIANRAGPCRRHRRPDNVEQMHRLSDTSDSELRDPFGLSQAAMSWLCLRVSRRL